MRRMHIIDEPHRMGGEIYFREEKYMHDPELREAYECGKREGWRAAMHEAERDRGGYHERRDWRELPPMMREHDHYMGGGYDDGYSERRGRDARGRYI